MVKYSVILLFILSVIIIVRGKWDSDFSGIFLKILNTRGILPFALPLIILPLNNIKYFGSILNVLFYASLLTFVAWAMNYDSLVRPEFYGEHIGAWLPFFSAFLLPFFQKFSKKKIFITYAIWLIYLLLMLLNARRNVTLSLVIYGLIAVFVFFKYYKHRYILNIAITICLGVAISSFLWLNVDSLKHNTFKRITERGFENTRKSVDDAFWKDFSNSNICEWGFGRGMDGTYHHRNFFDISNNKIINSRYVVETGYFHLILKGGALYLITILILLFKALQRCYNVGGYVYTYLFLFLLTYLLDLYTTDPLGSLSPRSLLFWFVVSISLSTPNINYKQ